MKTLALSAAVTALFALPQHAVASQVTLSFAQQHSTVELGETFFLEVMVAYDGTDKLLGGAVSFDFDATLLEVLNVALRAPTDVAGTTGSVVVNGDVGTIAGMGFASFNGIAGSFDFATIELRALDRTGLSPVLAYDSNDLIYSWVSESLEPVNVNSFAGTVTVVPEPATVALMLAGLGVLSVSTARWRRAR